MAVNALKNTKLIFFNIKNNVFDQSFGTYRIKLSGPVRSDLYTTCNRNKTFGIL